MNKIEVIEQMVQWVIKLSQFNFEYKPRTKIKAQVLADFIAEFTLSEDENMQDTSTYEWSTQMDR